MNQLDAEQIGSLVFLAVGIIMAVFHRYLGRGFCWVARQMVKRNPSVTSDPVKVIDEVCDEKKAPFRMFWLGVAFIVQGLVMLLIHKNP